MKTTTRKGTQTILPLLLVLTIPLLFAGCSAFESTASEAPMQPATEASSEPAVSDETPEMTEEPVLDSSGASEEPALDSSDSPVSPDALTVYLVLAEDEDNQTVLRRIPVEMSAYEASDGFQPLLNLLKEETGITVQGMILDNTSLSVDLTADMAGFINQGSTGASLRVETLARTFLSLPDVESVQFTIDREENVEMDHYSLAGWFRLDADDQVMLEE